MDTKDLLKKHDFFYGISDHNLDLLVECTKVRVFKPEQLVFSMGDPAKHFYLVSEGEISLEVVSSKNNLIKIDTILSGDILGWSWQFPPYEWNFSARSETDSTLIEFEVNKFYQTCNVNLLFAYEIQKRFAKVMLKRLQAARTKLIELYEREL